MNELFERLLEIMPRAASLVEEGMFSHTHWPRSQVEKLLDQALESAEGAWKRFLDVRREQILKGGAAGLIQLALAEPELRSLASRLAAGRTLLLARQPTPTVGPCVRVQQAPPSAGYPREFQAGHRGPMLAMVTLADGRVATAGQDRTVKLWDRGEPVQVHDEHWASVTCLQPWGEGLVSGCLDGRLRHYDRPPLRLPAPIVALAAEPPLVHAALANGDRETWNLDTGELVERRSTGCVPLLAIAARQGRVATAGQDGAIYLDERVLTGHVGPVRELSFLADGTLRSRGADGTVRDWNPEEAMEAREGHRGRVVALATHGERAISAGEDGQLLIWDAEGRLADRLASHPGPVCCLSQVVGDDLLSGSADGTVRWWNLATGTCRDLSEGGRPQLLGWLEPGVPLLVLEHEQKLTLVACDRWRVALPFRWSPPQALTLEVLPDGEVLVCGGDEDVYLARPEGVRKVRHHGQGNVRAVVFSDVVLSVGYHELAVWTHAGGLVRKRQKPDGHTTYLVRHPHERVVALHGLTDRSVTLEPLEGKGRRHLPGHLEYVYQCQFEPSGAHLYSIGADHTVRAIRLADGDNVASWVADCELTCLAVPADGNVVVGTVAGQVLRLDLVS